MKRIIHFTLALVLVFQTFPYKAWGAPIPQMPEFHVRILSPKLRDGSVSISEVLNSVMEERQRLYDEAPQNIKDIMERPVSSYFEGLKEGADTVKTADLEKLYQDAAKLHRYFEIGSWQRFFPKEFEETRLKEFILKLNAKSLLKVNSKKPLVRSARVGAFSDVALSQWTVEMLVISAQTTYIIESQLPEKTKIEKLWSLMSGPHLKGATKKGTILAGLVLLGYLAQKFPSATTTVLQYFFGVMLVGSFVAGPMAQLNNALTGFFLDPTTDLARRLNTRYMGPAKRFINNFFDRHFGQTQSTTGEGNNHTVRFPSLKTDGITFAGMTQSNHDENMRLLQIWWIEVSTSFEGLFRAAHRHGRELTLAPLNDEGAASQFVNTIMLRLTELYHNSWQIIRDRKAVLDIKNTHSPSQLVDLEETFKDFQSTSDRVWSTYPLTDPVAAAIDQSLQTHIATLKGYGLTDNEIDQLLENQVMRTETIASLVGALFLSEFKILSIPEGTRNASAKARQAWQAVRKILRLQTYLYTTALGIPEGSILNLVQEMYRRSGLKHSGDAAAAFAPAQCKTLVERLQQGGDIFGELQ